MKKIKHAIIALSLLAATGGYAQVQIDKAIQLTGSGTNAKVTGIQSITNAQDAVNADAVLNNTVTFATATGGTNAYAVTLPTATGYTTGMVVQFIANGTNTGSATINVNGLGAKTIMKNYNASLIANDIRSGQAVVAMYDGTNFQMLSQSANGSGAFLAHGKQIFYYQGGPQYFTVPDGVNSITVKMWGAGGGGVSTGYQAGSQGGGGAFVSGTLTVTPNTALTIIVGQGGSGGSSSSTGSLSYGGGGGSTAGQSDGTGGGRSAIQIGGSDVVTAGGGGAGANVDMPFYGNGGGGGAPTGNDGTSSSTYINDYGKGGTTSTGGAGGTDGSGNGYDGGSGSQYSGGTANQNSAQTYGGGGGGGGYYGGGAGAGGDATGGGGGGGGGSSYTSGAGFAVSSNQAGQANTNGTTPTSAILPGGNFDSEYQTGIGIGGNGDTSTPQGGNGLIIITW